MSSPIRAGQEQLLNTVTNGERLLEAKRQANLVTEEDYWQQKRDLLLQGDRAEEEGLQKQLARLQQEKLAGKDQIENARRILEVQNRLSKAHENAANALAVLAIKQDDALKQIRIRFEQAEAAARSYVQTVANQNARELAGIGKGNRQREDQTLARRSTRSAALARSPPRPTTSTWRSSAAHTPTRWPRTRSSGLPSWRRRRNGRTAHWRR